jgi:hypothetical protein
VYPPDSTETAFGAALQFDLHRLVILRVIEILRSKIAEGGILAVLRSK